MAASRSDFATWAATVIMLASYALLVVLDISTLDHLCAESQLIENLGAAWFLAAGALFGASTALEYRAARQLARPPRRLFWAIVLSCGMLWIALEEISYGQHWLGFKTPAAFEGLNSQREFNLHNLKFWSSERGLAHWFNIQRLFSLFWLAYCTLLPLAHATFRWPGMLMRAVYIPLASVPLGAAFLLNFALAKCSVLWWADVELAGPATELKETNYGLLWACFALAEFARQRQISVAVSAPPATAAPPSARQPESP